MQCDTPYPKVNDDRGFGLVEAVIATALFLVLLVISIGPIMSSLDRLDEARLTTEAEKLGEAQLESIRALDFDDVGLTSGNPTGRILASMTIPGDTSWVITTDVQWEGAITGTDDVNYKTVEIVVAHPSAAIDPVRFSSILSPDRLSGSSNKATVTVDLTLMEPSPSGIIPPKVFLVKSDGAGASSGSVFPLSGASPAQWRFPLLNPTDPNVGDPAYEMVMRLGPTLADTSFDGWYIAPTALTTGADRFQLFPAEIKTTTLPVYRPAQLAVDVTDVDTDLVIPNATLTLDNGVLPPENFTTTDGTFFIENAFGSPLAPDTYDITVSAFSYASETRSSVSVPAGYPSPLHSESFALEFQAGVPVTFDIEDTFDWPIPAATISVPGFGDLTTDSYGQATMVVPVGPSFTATIISPAGHKSTTATFNSGSGTVYKELGRPGWSYRVIHFYNGTGDHWGAKEYYGSEPYSHIEPDYLGNGTAVVFANNRRWDFGLLCSDDSVEWERRYVSVWSSSSLLNNDAGGASC